jgi:uncharacterized protein YndB with AHSA1/START domain
MPQQSSDTRQHPSTFPAGGPSLECAQPGSDVANQLLRIRAQRLYAASPGDVFASWTRRAEWESWMRLRARSRAVLAPYRGGALRLELAEGPTIHVITGAVVELRAPEFLSLEWTHHDMSDHGSLIEISFRPAGDDTMLTLVHQSISSRREAAWLMRLWTTVLHRLGQHVSAMRPSVKCVREFSDRMSRGIEPDAHLRSAGRTVDRGASSAA